MLPPLGAVLSASVDYQTAARTAVPAQIALGTAGSNPSLPLPTNLLSGGRIDILSLSGQLQLAQGLSIFAEAVGGYLKISRREGESLVDYAHRLAEALKSLTASQRAVLEQSLAQLVRGITLRMLTDILNNPLGAEASRLNAYLETAQLTGRDPAARAVVSSYRQNAAADPVTAPATASPSGAPVAADAGQHGTGRTGNTLAPTAAGPLPEAAGGRSIALQAHVQDAAALAAGDAGEPSVLAHAADEATTGRAPAGTAPRSDGFAQAQDAAKPPAQPSSLSSLEPMADDAVEALAKAANSEARGAAKPDATMAADPSSGTVGARAAAMAGLGGAAVIYDATALIRMAQRLPDEAGNRFVQEVLYQTAHAADPVVAEAPLAADDGPGSLVAALIAAETENALPAVLRTDAMRTAAGLDGLQAARASMGGGADDLLPPPPAAAGEAGKLSPAAQLPFEAAAFVAAAPMVAREGLAQAFVAYPQVQPPPKEEERDVERVSAIDEDGGNRPSQQDAQGDDQGAEDDEASGSGEGDAAGGDHDGHADHAEDLYWRMADLT
ncbi:hypothetical protein [Pseudorhizobium marinum]|uniref:hypothetical protein n=1 Tax=Pseudorhizobium marinum TaxID=1496690 RepID=UPI000AB8CC62|nr:hypothetical protein [Pseudorhizobium marinum]